MKSGVYCWPSPKSPDGGLPGAASAPSAVSPSPPPAPLEIGDRAGAPRRAVPSQPSQTCAPSAPRCCAHGHEQQGRSVARAKGPTPPLSTAPPSVPPPRQSLRGGQRNPEATRAARDKQQALKERLRTWIDAAPDRTDRLVRLDQETYTTRRRRRCEGSPLALPGMRPHITLGPHHHDAVWRLLRSGTTLLAQAVGAGQTFSMAAAGMQMPQAGLITKPLYVVPHHRLAPCGREACRSAHASTPTARRQRRSPLGGVCGIRRSPPPRGGGQPGCPRPPRRAAGIPS
jgi:hypothetical protein